MARDAVISNRAGISGRREFFIGRDSRFLVIFLKVSALSVILRGKRLSLDIIEVLEQPSAGIPTSVELRYISYAAVGVAENFFFALGRVRIDRYNAFGCAISPILRFYSGPNGVCGGSGNVNWRGGPPSFFSFYESGGSACNENTWVTREIERYSAEIIGIGYCRLCEFNIATKISTCADGRILCRVAFFLFSRSR